MAEVRAVNVKQVPREDEAGNVHQYYRIMEQLVVGCHDHLAEARIAIAMNYAWQPDRDNHTKLGKATLVKQLHKEFHGYDFLIELNYDACQGMSEEHITALIDHELCHCAVATDKEGEIVYDTRGRAVYRIRKHDLEEFRDVVARNGIWKSDIAAFVQATQQGPETPLFDGIASGRTFAEESLI